MKHLDKSSRLLMASAVFVLAAVPAQAQSAITGFKDDLVTTPSQMDVVNDTNQLLGILAGLPKPQPESPTSPAAAPPPPSSSGSSNDSSANSDGDAGPTNMEQLMLMLTGSQASNGGVSEIVEWDRSAFAALLGGLVGAPPEQPEWPGDTHSEFTEQHISETSGLAIMAALAKGTANQNASTLAAWASILAGFPNSSAAPVWADVLPTTLSAYYTGSAVAVMPNGASSKGDSTLQVDFTTRDVEGAMNFYSANPDLAGDIEFAGKAQIGGANHTMAGTMLYSGAFGGTIEVGEWSGGFQGSMAEMVNGDWKATVEGGPNAGVVHGKFGGQQ